MYGRWMKAMTASAVAIALVAVSAVNGLVASASATPTKNLVALGDSITFGYNLSDTNDNTTPSAQAFPALIAGADHFSVSNLGIPGWTSGDLLAALPTPAFVRAVRGASVITLDIGSNDLLHLAGSMGLLNDAASTTPITLTPTEDAQFTAAIDQFGKNLAQILSTLRAETNAPIVIYNLYDPFPSSSALYVPTEQFQTAENEIIAQTAAALKNVAVANAHAAFNGNQLTYVRVKEGDVHPTPLGQSVLATLGEQALAPMLASIQAASGVPTQLLAGSVEQTGGSVTGSLGGTGVVLSVPSGSLSASSEVDLTSQGSAGVAGLLPKSLAAVSEVNVGLASGVTVQSPYTLTLTNPAITGKSAVYVVTGSAIMPYGNATLSSGKAVITAKAPADFVVVNPVVTVVKGATQPVTGLPIVEEGALAIGLLVIGGGMVFLSRHKASI